MEVRTYSYDVISVIMGLCGKKMKNDWSLISFETKIGKMNSILIEVSNGMVLNRSFDRMKTQAVNFLIKKNEVSQVSTH